MHVHASSKKESPNQGLEEVGYSDFWKLYLSYHKSLWNKHVFGMNTFPERKMFLDKYVLAARLVFLGGRYFRKARTCLHTLRLSGRLVWWVSYSKDFVVRLSASEVTVLGPGYFPRSCNALTCLEGFRLWILTPELTGRPILTPFSNLDSIFKLKLPILNSLKIFKINFLINSFNLHN